MVAMRSGMLRAAKSNIAARRKEKASMVATNARPCAEPCMVKTAKRMKMATSADQRASVGKRPSWRAACKMIIVARAQGSACAAPTALVGGCWLSLSSYGGWANVCRTYRRWILVDADGASRVIFYSFEGKQK
jgi:hypothetical protein